MGAAGRTPEALAQAFRVPACHPQHDEQRGVGKRPGIAPARPAQRPVVRRGQVQFDDEIEQRRSRQAEVEAERSDAVATRHHARQDAVEEVRTGT